MTTINRDALNKMKTGDSILFHGTGFWFSYIVEWATWSEFSHVGMVLRDPFYIDPKLKGVYMLESGEESFPDAVDHKLCWGVQIVNLEKVFELYRGKIYHRPLKCKNPEIHSDFDQILTDLWSRIKDLPYDDSPWDLIRAEFGLHYGDANRTDTFFCSALQSFIYDQMKLFHQPVQWDMILPKDYDDGGRIEAYFIEDVDLDPKIQIKY